MERNHEQEMAIMQMYAEGVPNVEIANEFGINSHNVYTILVTLQREGYDIKMRKGGKKPIGEMCSKITMVRNNFQTRKVDIGGKPYEDITDFITNSNEIEAMRCGGWANI